MQAQKYWKLYVIGFIVVTVIGFASWKISKQPELSVPPRETKPLDIADDTYILPDVTPYLDEAKLESDAVIEKSLQDIRGFFDDAKKNSRSFAEDALGFSSKWRLVIDSIPAVERTGWRIRLDTTKGDRNEKFLNQKFEERIFTANQLINEVERSVENYVRRVEQIENNMLTKMKADLPDLPETSLLKSLESHQINDAFQIAVEKAIADSQAKTGEALTVEISAVIAGEILAAVAVRLGVSAGILGTGAVASLKTLGISVIVAFIIDYAVSWIWDWYADPKGGLAIKINEQLDTTICDTIVTELRQRLSDISQSRVPIREAAVYELVVP